MKKSIGIIIMVALITSLFGGCKKPYPYPVSIDITEIQYGDGMKAISNSLVHTIKEGEVIKYEGSLGAEFLLEEIGEEYVILKSSSPLSASMDPTAGIDMYTNQKRFRIEKGEVWYLNTPSFDCGREYVISYGNI